MSVEESTVPKWFQTLASVAMTIFTVVSLGAIPWAISISTRLATIETKIEERSTRSAAVDIAIRTLDKEVNQMQTRVSVLEDRLNAD